MMKSVLQILLLCTVGVAVPAAAQDIGREVIDLPPPSNLDPEIVDFERRHFRVERIRGKVYVDNCRCAA